MTKPSSTLANAIQLMDCFSKDEPYLGVREAARMTGISSSTTGRVLASLKELGLLVQDMETRQYAWRERCWPGQKSTPPRWMSGE